MMDPNPWSKLWIRKERGKVFCIMQDWDYQLSKEFNY